MLSLIRDYEVRDALEVNQTVGGAQVGLTAQFTPEPNPAFVRSDFINALQTVTKPLSPSHEGYTASEAVLRRVWDKPEEDEAWRDL